MRNALTFDLEDYYHVTAFADYVTVQDWDTQENRVERNTEHLLALLSSLKRRATFFTLGWVGERHPRIIRRIAECGHEIACHSHRHRLVYQLNHQEFLEDTRRAKQVLEEAGGSAVRGYRAPSFSITQDSLWAFEILVQLGFTYDSSIFPVRHPNYGLPAAPRFPFRFETPSGPIIEFPMSTVSFGKITAPIGGGAYLRFLPYWYTRWSLAFLNTQESRPACVYLHPWEIDVAQPRMAGSFTARVRHYVGLRGTEKKLRNLLRDFDFAPLGELVADCGPLQSTTPAGDWNALQSA